MVKLTKHKDDDYKNFNLINSITTALIYYHRGIR